jgi:hypothetical protein
MSPARLNCTSHHNHNRQHQQRGHTHHTSKPAASRYSLYISANPASTAAGETGGGAVTETAGDPRAAPLGEPTLAPMPAGAGAGACARLVVDAAAPPPAARGAPPTGATVEARPMGARSMWSGMAQAATCRHDDSCGQKECRKAR